MTIQGTSHRRGFGAIAGVLTAGTALGVGQLVAGITGASSSPVVVVGQLQIDLTPPWLKDFAITEFGAHDKQVLVGGILVVLAIFAAAIGVAAMRRLAYGIAGLVIFSLIGLFAASTRPHATFSSLLPTIGGALAAAVAAWILVDRADAASLRQVPGQRSPAPADGPSGRPDAAGRPTFPCPPTRGRSRCPPGSRCPPPPGSAGPRRSAGRWRSAGRRRRKSAPPAGASSPRAR